MIKRLMSDNMTVDVKMRKRDICFQHVIPFLSHIENQEHRNYLGNFTIPGQFTLDITKCKCQSNSTLSVVC